MPSRHSARKSSSPHFSRSAQADCLEHFQQSFEAAVFSAEAALLAGKARRPATRRTYNSRVSRYYRWYRQQKIDPLTAIVGRVADFLVLCVQVRRVGSYCSGIPHCHRSDGSLTSLIKGIFNERPPAPKKTLLQDWDLPLVLRFIMFIAADMSSLTMFEDHVSVGPFPTHCVSICSGLRTPV